MPHVEALHVEDVAELPQREDPADCVIIRVLVIGWRNADARHGPFGNVNAQPGDGDGDGTSGQFWCSERDWGGTGRRGWMNVHPRISLRCLCSLNQYGSAPNTKKNTARPNSNSADRMLAAYQTSPAESEISWRSLRLYN